MTVSGRFFGRRAVVRGFAGEVEGTAVVGEGDEPVGAELCEGLLGLAAVPSHDGANLCPGGSVAPTFPGGADQDGELVDDGRCEVYGCDWCVAAQVGVFAGFVAGGDFLDGGDFVVLDHGVGDDLELGPWPVPVDVFCQLVDAGIGDPFGWDETFKPRAGVPLPPGQALSFPGAFVLRLGRALRLGCLRSSFPVGHVPRVPLHVPVSL